MPAACMRSATPTPSKPFSRKSRAAVSTTRARLSSACCLVIRMVAPKGSVLLRIGAMPVSLLTYDDGYHHLMMTVIIKIAPAAERAGALRREGMLASALAEKLSRRGIHYGWAIAAV